ncbi:MAG: radical SAM protein [Campylobacterota bacterium]|nr:radical SAM protein [Campylobacterota bacterium]
MNIIFGPVNSRRFGVSLGIDLSPSHKQCNFDCLYCELAPAATVDHQTDIITVDEIIDALKAALKQHDNIDVITLTANGEPTLYPYLNELIDAIGQLKGKTETLILTNSAALVDEKSFHTLLKLDQVKLSLDAVTPDIFKKIDRPHQGVDVAKIVEAVETFSKQFNGKLFIEILFVHGLNDTAEEIKKLNDALLDILTTRIDLGTIDRPPAYPVQGVSYSELHAIAMQFDTSLPIHIASRQHAESCTSSYTTEDIINTLDKRPLTQEDIELLFDQASKMRLNELLKTGKIIQQETSGIQFFIPSDNLRRKRQKS